MDEVVVHFHVCSQMTPEIEYPGCGIGLYYVCACVRACMALRTLEMELECNGELGQLVVHFHLNQC